MNTYVALYKNKRIEVKAKTSLEAQTKARDIFKAKKRYDVTVIIVADKQGNPIEHKPTF